MARHWIVASLVVAGLLTATGLGIGFVGDDAYHLLILQGEKTPATDGNLYTFATGDPQSTVPFTEVGPFPWWTLPELKIVFARPLSSALHRLDYALFGRAGVYWHLHALLWYLALVLAWAFVARRTLPAGTAAIASLLFAINQTHWMPAVWLANRNALIACVPPLFGLVAHLRWREEGWKLGLPLSLLGYGVGMLGGEAWLGIAAYVAAYEMFGARGVFARRMAALAPAAVCAVGYAVAYKLGGYGVYGSGSYLQPLSLAYFAAAPGRALAMLGGLTVASPVDVWAFLPAYRWVIAAVGGIGVVLFVWLLRSIWRELDARERVGLRWLIAGALMSLAPVLAAFPMNRLLLAPSLGGSAVLACLMWHWWNASPPRSRGFRVACGVLFGINAVIAPLMWPAQSALVWWIGRAGERVYRNAEIDESRVMQQDLFLIAANDPLTILYPPILRRLNGCALPGSWHCLSASPFDHVVTRISENELEIAATRGALIQGVFAEILRGPEFPLKAGSVVKLRNAFVKVVEDIDGAPTRIALVCDRPLEDGGYLFLQWQGFELKQLQLPKIGESAVLRYSGKNSTSS